MKEQTSAAEDKAPKMSQMENAYQRLKAMIIAGEINADDQIDATRLVDVLGFGRTPVREALLRLQTEGIVEILPKRGVRIVKLSADDLTEIYQVISAVEIEAVRLLTPSMRHQRLITLIVNGDVERAVADHQAQRHRGASMLVDVVRRYRLSQL
jgi:DNA-binding GntR family transcriptional regulator